MSLQQMMIVVCFVLALVLGFVLVPFLKKVKANQVIRNDGPQEHLKKIGTPTLGGLIFLVPLVISCGVLSIRYPNLIPILLVTLGFGLIGFIDDLVKILKPKTGGILPRQKMLGLIVVATIFVVYLYYTSNIITEIIIPFSSSVIDFKWFFIPFSIIVLIATTNSVNLTDGLDGLVGGMSVIIMLFFCIIGIAVSNEELSIFSSAFIGGLLGFLIFNLKPARIFMGDTGSLALGGAIGAIAICERMPFILFFVCIIPILEAVSVIVQVISYKLSKKRIFKMAPLHHHFELSGYSEEKITLIFWIITILGCVLGFLSL